MTNHLSDRLAAELAVCEAAAKEWRLPLVYQPWGPQNQNGDYCSSVLMDESGETIVYEMPDTIGEFAESASTGYPLALQALQTVMRLHMPFEWSFGYGPVTSCRGCADQGVPQEEAEWPCPTIQAIQEVYGDADSS